MKTLFVYEDFILKRFTNRTITPLWYQTKGMSRHLKWIFFGLTDMLLMLEMCFSKNHKGMHMMHVSL